MEATVVDNVGSPLKFCYNSPLPMANFNFLKLALTSPKLTNHSNPKTTSAPPNSNKEFLLNVHPL